MGDMSQEEPIISRIKGKYHAKRNDNPTFLVMDYTTSCEFFEAFSQADMLTNYNLKWGEMTFMGMRIAITETDKYTLEVL